MSAITWIRRHHTFDFDDEGREVPGLIGVLNSVIDGGCRFSGLACIGGHQMIATYEEVVTVGFNGIQNPGGGHLYGLQRVYYSADDGRHWTYLGFNLLLDCFALHAKLSPKSYNKWYMGNISNTIAAVPTYDPTSSVMSMVTSAGLGQWRSVVPQTTFDSIVQGSVNGQWDTRGVVVLDNREAFVYGYFGLPSANYYQLIRSTDNGEWFTDLQNMVPPDPTWPVFENVALIKWMIYMGNDILIAGIDSGGGTDLVARSTDRGVSWTRLVAPDVPHNGLAGACALDLEDGVALIGDVGSGDSSIWRTADYGATWSLVPVPAAYRSGIPLHSLKRNGAAVLAGFSGSGFSGLSPWLLSVDGGQTFADTGAFASSLNTNVDSHAYQLATNDRGNFVSVVHLGTGSGYGEIWEGLLDGAQVASGPGECESFLLEAQPPPVLPDLVTYPVVAVKTKFTAAVGL